MMKKYYQYNYYNCLSCLLFQQDNLRMLFYHYLVVFQMDKKYKYHLFQLRYHDKVHNLYCHYLLHIHHHMLNKM